MKWFKDVFLPGFEKCNGRRISEKQFNVFQNYLRKFTYKESDMQNTIKIEYHFENLIIILQDSIAGYGKGWHEYYLTIK